MYFGKTLQAAATVSLLTVALGLPNPAYASPQGDLKDAARKAADEMRAAGAPQNRCHLGANFGEGHIIRSHGDLQVGDKLLYVNNHDVAASTDEQMITVLKQISPDAVIPVRVERDGQQLDLNISCENAANYHEPVLEALDYAGRKKVDDCVETLRPIAERDIQAAALRLSCATVSNNSERYDLRAFAAPVMENSINFARFKPDQRRAVVDTLRGNMAMLRRSDYDRFVAMTTEWPGDETLFEDTTPNWNRFKANAERAMLSSFFDPGSAIVEWPYGFTYGSWKPVLQGRIEGYWTCGRVNGKNRMGGYVGSRYFVVVLGHNAEVKFHQVGDGGDYDFVAGQCQNSVRHLPPASEQFVENSPSPSPSNGPTSMADELKKLADLKASGALTEEEYQAAKAKVLGSD